MRAVFCAMQKTETVLFFQTGARTFFFDTAQL